jgi:hypothetical protein
VLARPAVARLVIMHVSVDHDEERVHDHQKRA